MKKEDASCPAARRGVFNSRPIPILKRLLGNRKYGYLINRIGAVLADLGLLPRPD
ncbi:MAG: hypothetical protein IPI44_14505 [Sulfuritalea sp.]|nr:hypothetical protein [Sulfuritalea sp.]